MKFKKTIGIVLVFVLLFSLAACANNNTSDQTQTSTESATTASAAGSATSAKNTSSGKKAIVVYFSGSGNTKRVAELVANETGSELFELVPTTPYTDDDLNWRDEKSRVQKSITILRFKILNSIQLLFPIGKAMTPSCSAILSGGARRHGLSTTLSKVTTSPAKRSFRSAPLPATVSATAAASSHRWQEQAHGRKVCAFPSVRKKVLLRSGHRV